jgi:hypothetical protein
MWIMEKKEVKEDNGGEECAAGVWPELYKGMCTRRLWDTEEQWGI